MLFLSTFLACNQYEYFNIAGYEQADFSNKADILFVIDNSSSMRDEAVALGENFSTFINILTSEEGATESTENLDDVRCVCFIRDRARKIYRLSTSPSQPPVSITPINRPLESILEKQVFFLAILRLSTNTIQRSIPHFKKICFARRHIGNETPFPLVMAMSAEMTQMRSPKPILIAYATTRIGMEEPVPETKSL